MEGTTIFLEKGGWRVHLGNRACGGHWLAGCNPALRWDR